MDKSSRPTDEELAAVFSYKLKHRPLTPLEAAELLSCSPATLQDWRHDGTGVPYFKCGKFVYYSERSLLEWLIAGGRRNTSQKPGQLIAA